MLYPTIYAHSNFGTWNCWNANLSNGVYYICVLGTVGTLYIMLKFWNLEWNANLSNGLYML